MRYLTDEESKYYNFRSSFYNEINTMTFIFVFIFITLIFVLIVWTINPDLISRGTKNLKGGSVDKIIITDRKLDSYSRYI